MSEFRIRMETKDGQLVQDRKADVDLYYSGEAYYRYRRLDEKAVERTLEYDARLKGVRVVSWEAGQFSGVRAIVEWLK
ncbi:hypothetical protein CPT_Moby_263 [Stenotrophomonas phage Moby]|uniref:Uncharacterized protein n=1 Tax=Stenotrophomonas phage Moby TaxID=2601680 RepID=A0A5P8PML6_9CAUD|nr:hypothetical protein HWC58_gp135 [Stenotrophomonas phage Moby]QFR57988.1 hypothetical protein CPT_Moby_263 [Stenotrophomonas phage Moby]QYW02783.1 hypothetical protein CPT_Marzo_265 [Stenotrophomonas phage Marzo]